MKIRRTVFNYFAGFMLATFLFGSCTTEVDWKKLKEDYQANQSIAVPLGFANMTVGKILNQLGPIENVETEGTDVMLCHTDSAVWKVREYKLIPNTAPITRAFLPSKEGVTTLNPNNVEIFDFREDIELDINNNPLDQRVDYLKVKSAKFKITTKTNVDLFKPKNIKVTISFPGEKIVFDNPAITSLSYIPSSFNSEKEFTLTSFTIYTPNSAKSIPVDIRIEIKTENETIPIEADSKFEYSILVTDYQMDVAYGFFNPSSEILPKEEEIDLGDFQQHIPEGFFRFTKPSVELKLINHVGIKLGLNLVYAKAYRKNEANYDTITTLFKYGNPSTKVIINPAPIFGTKSITKYTVDRDFGQIHQLFDKKLLPNTVKYKYFLTREHKTELDFITPEPRIDVKYNVKLPIRLNSGSYIVLKDTIFNLNLDSLLQKDYADNATLILKINNGLPTRANFNLKLLDKKNNKVNTTIDDTFVIEAPEIGSNGLVDNTKIQSQEIKIEVDKDKIAQLRKADKIAYELRLDRNDNEVINLETTNTFKVKASIFMKGFKVLDTLITNE